MKALSGSLLTSVLIFSPQLILLTRQVTYHHICLLSVAVICIDLKKLVHAITEARDFAITKISWLMNFKEIIAVYNEIHMKLIYVKMKNY